jgi:hypothetical protein
MYTGSSAKGRGLATKSTENTTKDLESNRVYVNAVTPETNTLICSLERCDINSERNSLPSFIRTGDRPNCDSDFLFLPSSSRSNGRSQTKDTFGLLHTGLRLKSFNGSPTFMPVFSFYVGGYLAHSVLSSIKAI